jgi:Flp pilus assembly protein TadG
MVEFALALPILLLVIYGLLEAGRLIFTIVSVTNASREAVRYASADGLINSTGPTRNYDDCVGIRNTAKKVGFLLGLQDSQIQIFHDTGPNTTAVSYCPAGGSATSTVALNPGDRVLVNVNTQYTVLLPLVPFTSRPISSSTARTFMGIIDLAPTPTPAS